MTVLLAAIVATMAFLVGMLLFVAVPFVAGALPDPSPRKIMQAYAGLMHTALRRGALLNRKQAGTKLIATKHDAKGEAAKIGRETKHFPDPNRLMSYAKGYPFGIAPGDHSVIIDAKTAAVGEQRRAAVDTGADMRELTVKESADSDRERQIRAALEHVTVPPTAAGVRLEDYKYLLGGDGDPRDGELTVNLYDISQDPFESAPLMDTFTFVGTFAATVGVCWLAAEFAKSGDGSGGGMEVGLTLLPVVL